MYYIVLFSAIRINIFLILYFFSSNLNLTEFQWELALLIYTFIKISVFPSELNSKLIGNFRQQKNFDIWHVWNKDDRSMNAFFGIERANKLVWKVLNWNV